MTDEDVFSLGEASSGSINETENKAQLVGI